VTFTLIPEAIVSSMAAMPSRVAGILTMRFGRLTARHSRFASRTVAVASWASVGSTSMLT
jgi:hypothetical protein